uniref:SCP domain-containing protein n=1 Tax=Mesocestoides corti TaxID=53468 RepID=A0A5K3FQC3_MESCO
MHKVLLILVAMTWCVLADAPSEEERNRLMECHTKLREEVQPTASNMQLLSYSLDLQKLAEEFVALCQPTFPSAEFNPQYQNVGYVVYSEEVNKATISNKFCNVTKGSYDYATNDCEDNCFDYIQMVWANSTQVGCATHTCTSSSAKQYTLFACLYKPSLRILTDRPYEGGNICSKCPNGYGCHRNQCDKSSPPLTSTTSISAILSPTDILLLFVSLVHWF